jgi:hypothetical protein
MKTLFAILAMTVVAPTLAQAFDTPCRREYFMCRDNCRARHGQFRYDDPDMGACISWCLRKFNDCRYRGRDWRRIGQAPANPQFASFQE